MKWWHVSSTVIPAKNNNVPRSVRYRRREGCGRRGQYDERGCGLHGLSSERVFVCLSGGWLWWGQWPFRGRELSHCEKRRSRSAAGPLIMTYESSTDAHRKKNHSQPLWSLWLHTDISQIGPNMMMMAHFILIFISDQGLRPFYLINVATSISRQARKDHSYCRSKEETDQLLPVFSSSHAAASWHHPLQVILRSSTDCHRGRFFPRCGRATWLLHESAVCRCCSCSCKWCVLSHIPWWTTDIIMTCLFGAMMMNYP